MKRVTLELGGKSANIVFADSDVDGPPRRRRERCSTTPGQDCCARSRILVERSVFDRFVDGLVDASRRVAGRRSSRRDDRDGPARVAAHRAKVASFVDK